VSVLSDVREAIADRVRDAGLDSSLNVFAYGPPNFPLPALVVVPSSDTYITYHGSFDPASGVGRMMTVNLIARLFVPLAGSQQSGDQFVDQLLSSATTEAMSVADAIEAGGYTLNGAVAHAMCVEASGWSVGELNDRRDVPVISVDIPIVVRIQRS
jgi:hypothetical protein